MAVKIRTELTTAVPDAPGQLSRVLRLLSKAGVNLLGFHAFVIGAGTSEVRLVPDNGPKASAILEKEGYEVATTEVVTMVGPSGKGEGAKLLHRLEGLNLEYTWATTSGAGKSLVVIKAPDPKAVVKALT